MRNKFFMFFVAVAAFTGFTSQRVEATSALPSLLVIQLSTAGINSIVLSTNTLGMNVDADITSSTTGGIDEQLIGYVEWNATKNNLASQSIQMTQMEQWSSSDVGAPAVNLFAAQNTKCGGGDSTDSLIEMIAVKVYTNVDPAASISTIVYIAPTQLLATNTGTVWGANLTAPTVSTYCGWIGVLSFYMVDDLANSVAAGTFIATMQFSIET